MRGLTAAKVNNEAVSIASRQNNWVELRKFTSKLAEWRASDGNHESIISDGTAFAIF